MHKTLFTMAAAAAMTVCIGSATAQINLNRVVTAGSKTVQALTVSDADILVYTKQFIEQSDKTNTIATGKNPYAVRIAKLIKMTANDGIDIKVYITKDVNAFACADGSVRVFSGLMDLMSDEEVLGVIGHEIGHVKHQDTKNAFKNALLTSAAKDAIASTGSGVAALTDSQLGAVGEAFLNAHYSQKQESAADTYGYDFLKAHNVNPWYMAMSFEKLLSLEQASGAAADPAQKLFASHPDTASRIKVMSAKATADKYTRPVTPAPAPAAATKK